MIVLALGSVALSAVLIWLLPPGLAEAADYRRETSPALWILLVASATSTACTISVTSHPAGPKPNDRGPRSLALRARAANLDSSQARVFRHVLAPARVRLSSVQVGHPQFARSIVNA